MSIPIQINKHQDSHFDSWFLHGETDFDIVISSRAGLHRNLEGHIFPTAPTYKENREELEELLNFLCQLDLNDRVFHGSMFSEISGMDKKLLSERRIISSRTSRERLGALVCDSSESISLSLYHQDHLRFAAIGAGNCITQLTEELNTWAAAVEKAFPFARSDSFGYLTAKVDDSGLGLRISMMLQLILCQELEDLDQYFFQLMKKGYTLRGFTDNKDEDTQSSLGGFYQIYAPSVPGMDSDQMLQEMLLDIQPLLEKERQLRKELKSGRFPWVEDKINRSFGILKYCKLISADEAQKRLSYIRLGITLGWIDGLSLNEVSAMLILVQDAHITAFLEQSKESGPFLKDERRARFIREVFESGLPYRR